MRKWGKSLFLTGIMTVSIVALTGCFGRPAAMEAEADTEQAADIDRSSASGEEGEAQEENKEQMTEKQENASGLGTLRAEAAAYFGTTYGDHLKKGGDEAEFLHGGRYIAKCPDLDAYVVYVGEWHEDTAEHTLEDSSEFLRLEGNLAVFFEGMEKELEADEFLKGLEENYTVMSEYRESAQTAYYVSATDYLHIELASKEETGRDAVIEIACGKNEKISPDSYCWVMGGAESGGIFSELPSDFVFSSGAGGWSTDIEVAEDGTFTGSFHDSDMGSTGEGYPNGTVYLCNFSGKFSDPEPTEKPYVYSMKLLEMQIENKDKTGTQEIEDETLFVYSDPYGFDHADEFLIYMPGTPMSDMSEACRSWLPLSESIFAEIPDGFYVIYNIGGEEAFTGQNDGSIWYRDCRVENGKAYVNFSPSYYMGSYLSFFTDADSPASLSLTVPWDGKNREPMECEKAWGEDDGTRVRVTVEEAEDSTPEVLKYAITVECISDPQFDFSAWGSSEPGKFKAVFTEQKAQED